MALLMQLSVVVSALNVIILIGLLAIYAQCMRRAKSGFTMGLVLFATFLLVHNLVGLFSYLLMESYFHSAIAPYMISLTSAELAGLAILFGESLK